MLGYEFLTINWGKNSFPSRAVWIFSITWGKNFIHTRPLSIRFLIGKFEFWRHFLAGKSKFTNKKSDGMEFPFQMKIIFETSTCDPSLIAEGRAGKWVLLAILWYVQISFVQRPKIEHVQVCSMKWCLIWGVVYSKFRWISYLSFT